MTAFEIISIVIGILSLLFAFGSLIVAFLTFLDKRKIRGIRRNKIASPVCTQKRRRFVRT